MKKAIVIYWSRTGNTEKVAHAIREGLEEAGVDVSIMKPEEAGGIDYFNYDLVCLGFPSYSWHPPGPVTEFLKRKFRESHEKDRVKLGDRKSVV